MKNLKKIKEFSKVVKEIVTVIHEKEGVQVSNFFYGFRNEFCKLYLEITFINGRKEEVFINEKEWGDTEECHRWNYEQLEIYFGADLKNRIVSAIEMK